MDYEQLLGSIKDVFIHQDEYLFDKHVPELVKDGKFIGDYFNQLAIEPRGEQPPRFYHTFSPFDIISNKAPHHAVVFEGGKMLLNIGFDDYVALRTAAMSALVLQALGVGDLSQKRVLLFGAGHIAAASVKILASQLRLSAVDVISRSGDLSRLQKAVKDTRVAISPGGLESLGEYDVIICHTQTDVTLLSSSQLEQVKQGAFLASFISSTSHGEFPDEVYDADQANVITDWEPTLLGGAQDLHRAVRDGRVAAEDVIYVKDLLEGHMVDSSKRYTIYRSTGTPMQNMAILRNLIQ